MLMSPNKTAVHMAVSSPEPSFRLFSGYKTVGLQGKNAVHGCHFPGDMAVLMRITSTGHTVELVSCAPPVFLLNFYIIKKYCNLKQQKQKPTSYGQYVRKFFFILIH